MNSDALYYILANIVAMITLLCLFIGNLNHGDYHYKQYSMNHLLIAVILLCGQDIFWTLVDHDIVPKNNTTFILANYIMCVAILYVCGAWLCYTQTINGKTDAHFIKRVKIIIGFYVISAIVLAPVLFIFQDFWIQDGRPIMGLYVMIYAFAIVTFFAISSISIRLLLQRENYIHRKTYIINALSPIVALGFGFIQMFTVEIPLMCSGLSITMLLLVMSSLLFQNITDPLTGLMNRNGLRKAIDRIEESSKVSKHEHLLIMVDLNDFKNKNDTLGHLKGDEILVNFASAIREYTTKTDNKTIVCRYGGDEFLIIVKNANDKSADEFKTILEDLLRSREETKDVHFSAGYVMWNGTLSTFDNKLSAADQLMYKDKKYNKSQNLMNGK